jgi:hypothetical protein
VEAGGPFSPLGVAHFLSATSTSKRPSIILIDVLSIIVITLTVAAARAALNRTSGPRRGFSRPDGSRIVTCDSASLECADTVPIKSGGLPPPLRQRCPHRFTGKRFARGGECMLN